jgi:cell division protein FtsI (penicillin-binding protein 3)
MNPSLNPALSLRLPVWRARVLLLLVLCGFAVLAARALYLQGLHQDFLQQKGESRYTRVLEVPAHRGMITDRSGEPLAVSTPVESVWISPADAELDAAQRGRLARLLDLDGSELARKLAETDREFVFLKRHLAPELAMKVVALDLPGVSLQREYRRYYPAADVMAQVVGFTSVDDAGLEGMEFSEQKWLAGKAGSRKVIKDRLGRVVEDVQGLRAPQHGRDLVLSIDSRIQYLAYRELKSAVAANGAKAGGLVVLDVKTGEILALANWPTYNPNNRSNLNPQRARNRVVSDLFEPGSTLKPFTAAAALESRVAGPNTLVDVSGGTLTVGTATIHDAHREHALTVSQVIQKSSNVGAAKLALATPREALWKTFNDSGFGIQPGSGFPGEASGRLRDHRKWKPIEQATLSYGHGISVSLLQLARAYTVFATDGLILPITMIRNDEPAQGTRVISEQTARAVRNMLESVTESGGTGVRGRVMGFRVAGKTGTAHKLENGVYAHDRYVSSFIGFAPVSEPRLLIAVMLDEPSTGEYYGGVVAAPVFSQVMSGALRALGVQPDAPVENHVPLEGAPLVKEEV